MSAVDLDADALEVTGRILPASNATFQARIGDVVVVYKPVAGERPLWDFPDRTLARREVASYLVSEALGWDVVPHTWLRDGPMGEGMVQRWCEVDPHQQAVTVVPADQDDPPGARRVLEGLDAGDMPVALLHEDTPELRRMAVFDVVVNNADRKGGHVLEMVGGHRYGVDHGLTFQVEPYLRTVLWGWVGEELTAQERDGVQRVRRALDEDLGERLGELLDDVELLAVADRCDELLTDGVLPGPHGGMPAVPWPPF